ncbi:MAG TPA: T9SS type A sorting domain-containing protein [Candidatus Acidoferrales bacterium]|nr:T9SS type A sorting domain-containing protein [Candidatus Acidoferrales bacterium]
MKRAEKHFTMSEGALERFFVIFQLSALVLLFQAGSIMAQPISSNGTGGGAWGSSSTWAGGSPAPGPGNDVTIVTGDSVYTSGPVSCASLTIQPGAKLALNVGKLTMTGDFSIGANAWFYDNDSLKAWPDNATSYTIDAASNFAVMGASAATLGSQSADSTFGNVYILARTPGLSFSANLTIKGDLIISDNTTSNAIRGISPSVRDNTGESLLTHHVMGNVRVIFGILSAVDGKFTTASSNPIGCIFNIDGNVTVGDYSNSTPQGRFGPFSSDDQGVPNFGEFNIGGNLSLVNGGRLHAGNSTSNNSANTGIINIGGNFSVDTNAAFATNSNGETFAINFVGNGPQTVSLGKSVSFSSSTHLITLCDTVGPNSTVQFTGGKSWNFNCPSAPSGNGAFVVYGKLLFGPSDTLKGLQNFVLEPGGTLGTANVNGIDTTIGSIQVSGTKSLPTTGSYAYNGSGTATQAAGAALPPTMNDLTVSDSAVVVLGANETVTGTLTLNTGGKLEPGSQTLTLTNKKANAVVGDSASYVIGSLTRADSATGSYLFPIGDQSAYHGVALDFTTAPSASSDLTASFTASDPGGSVFPSGITGYWNGGYWTVNASGTPTGTFDLTVYAKEALAVNSPVTLIGKPALSDPWAALNATQSHASADSGNYVTESGVTAYGIYGAGFGTIVGLHEKPSGIPTKIAIGNYPNPFNPTTTIQIAVPKNAHVALTIYNDLGQKVATIVDQNLKAGYYEELFDGSTYSSGVYFARLSVGNQVIVGKMLMIK